MDRLRVNELYITRYCFAGKGKAVAVHPWTDPEDSRRLRLTDVKTIGT